MKTQRWRITYSKKDEMRYTGHLDLILTWERTFRRSGLPLAYSEGYSPRPLVVLADPLPLGYISKGEIGDFWLSEEISQPDFINALGRALPPGLEIHGCLEIADLHGGKLPSLVQSAVYSIAFKVKTPELPNQIALILASQQIKRTRKGKTYDLRPLIEDLVCLDTDTQGVHILEATLKLLPGATGRPDEVLRELGIPIYESLICREKINLKDPEDDR